MDFTLDSTVPGRSGARPTTLDGTASLRLHPSLAGRLSFTSSGQSTTERIVDTKFYVLLPQIAARDGGRPWVLVDLADASKTAGIDYSQLLRSAEQVDPTRTLQLLAARRRFHEIGVSTVDSHRVVGLTGSFTPATLTQPGISRALLAQLKAKLAGVGATRETVTMYLTYAGLPVRILTSLATRTYGTLTSTIDIRQINIPVLASPPPAAQTITLTQLRKTAG
jgi:hypothetical protein